MRIVCIERDGRWKAHAERDGTHLAVGPEYEGATEPEAVAKLTRWLEWQGEHAAALDALQQCQQAYHRVLVGSAFASSNPGEASSALELQKQALHALEVARVMLDEVRARKPE